MKVIGRRIRKQRIKKGLTIQKLAELLGLSNNFMGQVERGISTPSLETLIKIADKLELSLDYIVGTGKSNNKFSD